MAFWTVHKINMNALEISTVNTWGEEKKSSLVTERRES